VPLKKPMRAAARGGLRVLLAIPTLGVGGAERAVGLLARNLLCLGHTPGVVSMYDSLGTWIEAELRAEGVPLYFLGKRRGPDPRMVFRMSRAVADFRADLVHTHLYTLQYAFAALASPRRPRIVHTLHNLAERESHQAGRWVQQIAFRTRAAPVAIGDEVARSMVRVYGMPPRRTIPNGIPVSEYAPNPGAREALRNELAIPPEAPVLLSAARMDVQKNHAGLLRAFASRRMAALNSHLLLAGRGPLRAELEGMAHELGLEKRVRFLGVRSDIPRVLAAADVFVLASHYEGNPLTVMEAMAAGKPVLATAVGCVPELVAAATGRLVPPGDEGALEAAMLELAGDLPQARALGEEAARVAQRRFDARAMTEAYEALYREVA
jgi:glycosyltransferase involved in cell wall biosynthesis